MAARDVKGRERARARARDVAVRNRLATVPRDAIALAFEQIGGVSALAEWVNASEDNRKLFYTSLYPKIFGSRTGRDPESPRIHKIERVIVDPAH